MAEFHYVPTGTGVISGREVLRQTEDAINNALEDGGDTREIAERALANSETALQQSGQAVDTANTAADTATQAQTTAGTALATANQASATAQTALSTAQQASTTATNAVTAAQAAQTAAENAATDAADSEDIAAQALTSAQAAQTAAEAAQTAAETAQTSADQSATLATQAQTAAAQSAEAAGQAAQSVAASARQIGEIVTSTLPLSSAGLHLLDGALIDGSGIYADFVDYIAGLYENDPTAAYFTDETTWQQSITDYGVCGKFVYDSVNETVRLPKITGIVEGTTDLTALGDLVEAGLPNIVGKQTLVYRGSATGYSSGAMSFEITHSPYQISQGGSGFAFGDLTFNASDSNSIYGNSQTVQPQTIKALVYIVIATVTKTEIQVDIDEIATDLNGKADTDLSNVTPSQSFKDASIGWGQPDYSAAIAITLTLNTNVTYTAPEDGFIVFTLTSNNASANSYIKINGHNVISVTTPASSSPCTYAGIVPVSNGNTVVIRGCGGDSGWLSRELNYAEFVPCKGV